MLHFQNKRPVGDTETVLSRRQEVPLETLCGVRVWEPCLQLSSTCEQTLAYEIRVVLPAVRRHSLFLMPET